MSEQNTQGLENVDPQAVAAAVASNTPQAPSVTPNAVEVPGVGPVTHDELVRGYMRQSDYTQKTQAIAGDRENVRVAQEFMRELEANPALMIQGLAESYEIDLASLSPAQQQNVIEQLGGETPSGGAAVLPPEVQAQLNELTAFKAQSEERALQAEVNQEFVDLKQKYGDFDEVSVMHFAIARGLPDLEVAYLAWDRQNAHEKGVQQGISFGAAREAASIESGTTVTPGATQINSVEDAFRHAMRTMPR